MSLLTALTQALPASQRIDRYLEVLDPAWSTTEVRARVVDVVHETDDVTTLVLLPNRLWTGHRAGQSVLVGVAIDGVRHTRRFSISSSEHRDDGCITLTIKARGLVSRHLAQPPRKGEVVTLSQAEGDFVLPEQRPSRLLLVAGGSGITPIMSMLRTLRDERHTGEITLIDYARSANNVIFAEEISRSGVDVRFHFDTTFQPEHLAGLADRLTFLCAPEPLMALVRPCVQGELHEHRFTEVEPVSVS